MSTKTKRIPIPASSQGRILKCSPDMAGSLALKGLCDVPEIQKDIHSDEPSLITWGNHHLSLQKFDGPEACPPDWTTVFEIHIEIEQWCHSWL